MFAIPTNLLRLCLLIMLFTSCNWISAQSTPVNALEIVRHRGENSYLKISDELEVYVNPSDALLEIYVSGKGPINIAFDDVAQCNHVYHDFNYSGISDIDSTEELQFDGHTLELNVTSAELYSISGVCLNKYISGGEPIIIDLDQLDFTGLLILNYGNGKSIKIRK